jgi:drug/metabolite transporter (DMT)-like permease
MSRPLTLVLTSLAMIAFAANSLLCRTALRHTGIDPASFTGVRIVSGAATLWLIVRKRHGGASSAGGWISAAALFAYAAGFSYAYITLTASTGALLLFGSVQMTMIGYGLRAGERLDRLQSVGLLSALGGLVGLLLPGLSAPPILGSVLMLGAGVAWGAYSIRGRGAADPIAVTAGNFLRAAVLAALLSAVQFSGTSIDLAGLGYAVASGALTSGLGYVVWYLALRGLKVTSAAAVQLSVPVLAALGGVLFLGESITLRLMLASVAILGGIALVVASAPASAAKAASYPAADRRQA